MEEVIRRFVEYFQTRGWSLAQAFAFLDSNRNGYVSFDDFVKGVNICMQNTGRRQATRDELWPIFKRFDLNGDGKIIIEELSAHFSPTLPRVPNYTIETEQYYNARGPGLVSPSGGGGSPTSRSRADEIIARVASAIVRKGLTPAQLFHNLDLDRSGRLSWTELERMILSFQPDLTQAERTAVFRRFDIDATNDIDVNEFCRVLDNQHPAALVAVEVALRKLGEKLKHTDAAGKVWDAFHIFDLNGDGLLTRDEWVLAMRSHAPDITESDCEAVFRRFDTSGDGYLNIQEFHSFFQEMLDRAPPQTPAAPGPGPPAMPVYVPPPAEEPWEMEVLNLVKDCLSTGRSGLTITEVFRRLDIDGTMTMSRSEFHRMVSAYRPDLQPAHMDRLFDIVNYSMSGQITLSEFMRRFG